MRRKRLLTVVLAGLTCIAGWGCATSQRAAGIYTAELGRAPSQSILIENILVVLNSHGYQVHSVSSRMLETEWRLEDAPYALQEEGITQLRDRIIVILGQRGRGYYTAQMRGEEQVLMDGQWQQRALTAAALDRYRAIAAQVKQRLQPYMTQE